MLPDLLSLIAIFYFYFRGPLNVLPKMISLSKIYIGHTEFSEILPTVENRIVRDQTPLSCFSVCQLHIRVPLIEEVCQRLQ